jgi:hypothetical protein
MLLKRNIVDSWIGIIISILSSLELAARSRVSQKPAGGLTEEHTEKKDRTQ